MMEKMDRRTQYTIATTKKAFLALLSEKRYNDITVTGLCDKAGISRSTFYQNFQNIGDVLELVMADVLNSMRQAHAFLKPDDQNRIALAKFIHSKTEYRGIFFDNSLTDYVVQKLCECSWDDVLSAYLQNSTLNENQVRAIVRFQVGGCLMLGRTENVENWDEIQRVIDIYLQGAQSACIKM